MTGMKISGSDDSDEYSVIMSLQYLHLKDDKVNVLLKVNEITDRSIMLEPG